MAYELGVKFNSKVVAYSCSSGTREGDLKGRTLNTNGLFQLGYLVVAVEIANEEGICILYLDELNALEPELQKMLNSLLDDRRLINANSKLFRINKGCKLIVIATMNPSSYAGTVPLNPDLRSRFCGLIMPFPTANHLSKVVDWTGIPEDDVRLPLIQLATDIFQYKVHGDVDYVVTTRDLKDFCRKYRNFKKRGKTAQECLDKSLAFTIYIKFGDKAEKELVEKSANDTFPDQLAGVGTT
jgi:MoxR-like ATPase